MLDEQVEQVSKLLESGEINEAREFLWPIIEANPQDEAAWLWYAYTFENQSDKIQVIQECLRFNPDSQIARQALTEMSETSNEANQEQLHPFETLRSILRKAKPYLEIFNAWFSKQEGVVKAAVVSAIGLLIPGCFALLAAMISRPSQVVIVATALPTSTRAAPTSTPIPITTQTSNLQPNSIFVTTPPTPILVLFENLSEQLSPSMRVTVFGAIGGILVVLGLWLIWIILFSKTEQNKVSIFAVILVVLAVFVTWQIWGNLPLMIVVGSALLVPFLVGALFMAMLYIPYFGGSIAGAIIFIFLSIGGCFIYFATSNLFIYEYMYIALIIGASIGGILGLLLSSINGGQWHAKANPQ